MDSSDTLLVNIQKLVLLATFFAALVSVIISLLIGQLIFQTLMTLFSKIRPKQCFKNDNFVKLNIGLVISM